MRAYRIVVLSAYFTLGALSSSPADAAKLRDLTRRLPREQQRRISRLAHGSSALVAVEVAPGGVRVTVPGPGGPAKRTANYPAAGFEDRQMKSGLPAALVFKPGKPAVLLYRDAQGVRAVEHHVRDWRAPADLQRRFGVSRAVAARLDEAVRAMEVTALAAGDTAPVRLVAKDPRVTLKHDKRVTKTEAELAERRLPGYSRDHLTPTTVEVSGLGSRGVLSAIGLMPHSAHVWQPYREPVGYGRRSPEHTGETLLRGVERALGEYMGHTTFRVQLRDADGRLVVNKQVKGDDLVTLAELELPLKRGDNHLTITPGGQVPAQPSQFSAGRQLILRWNGE